MTGSSLQAQTITVPVSSSLQGVTNVADARTLSVFGFLFGLRRVFSLSDLA